jgi:predicted transcriptional regulator
MDKHLTVRVDAEELERAERIATQSSTTRSDVVRAALLHGLAMLEDRVRVDLDAVQAARAVVLGCGK